METTIRDTSGQDRPIEKPRSQKVVAIAVVAGLLVTLGALAVPGLLRWSSVDQSFSIDRLRFAAVERGPFVRDVSVQGRIVAELKAAYAAGANSVAAPERSAWARPDQSED